MSGEENDVKSVSYTISNLSKTVLRKAKNSAYNKDIVFVNLYEQLENDKLSLVTPFIDKKSNIDHSTLYSISKPFAALHADITHSKFLAKSAVDPKYCLLIVNLFTSKIYVYPIKNRSLSTKKLALFYNDINQKRTGKMCL